MHLISLLSLRRLRFVWTRNLLENASRLLCCFQRLSSGSSHPLIHRIQVASPRNSRVWKIRTNKTQEHGSILQARFHPASDAGRMNIQDAITNTRKQGKRSIRTRRLVIQGPEVGNVILLYEIGRTVGLGGASGLIVLSQSDENADCDDNSHREKENWQGK